MEAPREIIIRRFLELRMDGAIAHDAATVERHICNGIGVLPELIVQDAGQPLIILTNSLLIPI